MLSTQHRRLLLAFAVPLFLAMTAGAALAESQPSTPRLSINIPTVTFSSALKSGGYVSIAWLPEYIIGLYNYGLTIGGVLAAVMMMWGGFQWMVGSPDSGKKKIINSLVGLVVLFGAYIILSVVNPTLTTLASLNLQAIKNEPLIVIEKSEESQRAEASGTSAPGKNVALDEKYKAPVDMTMPTAASCKSKAVSQDLRDATVRAQAATGVPAAVLLGQWSIESGDGASCIGPANKRYNCWGVKCWAGGYQGNEVLVSAGTPPTCPSTCMLRKTKETVKGVSDTYYACFQVFDTFDEAVIKHSKAVKRGNWQDYAKNPVGFAKFVQGIGYATATNYADAVISRMKQHCLLSPEAAAVQ